MALAEASFSHAEHLSDHSVAVLIPLLQLWFEAAVVTVCLSVHARHSCVGVASRSTCIPWLTACLHVCLQHCACATANMQFKHALKQCVYMPPLHATPLILPTAGPGFLCITTSSSSRSTGFWVSSSSSSSPTWSTASLHAGVLGTS